ncbi:MAG: hypothetical protein FWE86_03735 [Oscillospiraceae bacterium]|nr:hypothetical protein [Oscillospiraceae bacterium]
MATFPVGSFIGIIIAAALIIMAVKLIKSIAKPIISMILVVAALLLIFGIVDLATFIEKGEELADSAISCAERRSGEDTGESAGFVDG